MAPFPQISITRGRSMQYPDTYTDGAFAALCNQRVQDGTAWIMLRSGGSDMQQARYSIAGWDPILVYEGKSGTAVLTVPGTGTIVWDPSSLLDTFGDLLESVHHDIPFDAAPFSGGFLGYFAYDIKNDIERLPQTAIDDMDLPDIFQMFPGKVLIHDRKDGSVTELQLEGSIDWERQPHGSLPSWSALGRECATAPQTQMTETQYKEAVTRIREYIREGDIYQANLAQRFVFSAPEDAYAFWDQLYARNPAPFYAYIHTPRHRVLSTSMERCVRRQGRAMRSQPIKGTRPRGTNPAHDDILIGELRNDPKENAELSMIVDLVRNDMSRVCEPRTVRVTQHARLDSYANVHHLSSVIDGKLLGGVSISEVLKALLPAGSVTGCPKIRAMEIIDELEPVARHLYTGCIGYTGLHGTMDLSVAIRTAICSGGSMYVSMGSGIVYDSDPAREYQETLDKGDTFFTLIRTMQ